MPKLIKTWQELAKVPANDKYRIIVDLEMCNGWIVPVCDEPEGRNFKCHCDEEELRDKDFWDEHVYLSTHTFYGSQYKYSTKVLQKHGFDIEIDNWDKEGKNAETN